MATINELKTEINNYLFPNILEFKLNGEIEYQINGIWIDQIKENYFFNESLILTQMIEDTASKSDNPILIIERIKHLFERRIFELNSWKKTSLIDYLMKHHAVAISDNENDIDAISYQQSKVKKITLDLLFNAKPNEKLFNLSAFYNMIINDDVHQKEEFESIKLLYHIHELSNNISNVYNLINEIIHDYENFKIVRFEDYFKSFYKQHKTKVQVDLKLKDLAYFFHFVYTSGLFVMHPDIRKNKKMLMEFFVANFMYTDGKGNPKHFKNFIKEISDLATEDKKFQHNFADGLIHQLNEFKNMNIFRHDRFQQSFSPKVHLK